MAQTLNANATDFAAANWSGAGFGNDAELAVVEGTANVITNLDQNGSSVSLFLVREAFKGNIGSAGDPLICDVDGATATGFADATLAHFGSGKVYFEAGGGNTLCDIAVQGGTGGLYLEGGTVTQIYMSRGQLNASSGTVVTNIDQSAGNSVLANNATAVTSGILRGGRMTTRRDGTFTVKAGATLVVDCPDASPTYTITVEKGGQLVVKNTTAIGTLNLYGSADLRMAQDPTTITTLNYGPSGSLIRGDSLLTITTESAVYGYRDAGNPMTGSI